MASALPSVLLEEVFLRLPPEEPEHLVRASAVRKPWRCILSDCGFRRRYLKLHGEPPVLGFFQLIQEYSPFRKKKSGLLPIRTHLLLPPHRTRPSTWLDHLRRPPWPRPLPHHNHYGSNFGFVVWDPMTDEQHRVPPPLLSPWTNYDCFTAAVLCAVEGCDHCGCQGGPFHVVALCTEPDNGVTFTSARMYSSETGAWSELSTVYHQDCAFVVNATAVLVGGALYFAKMGGTTLMTSQVFEYQLASLRLSVFDVPPKDSVMYDGTLVTAEDGGLRFATVQKASLILWSRETGTTGADGWAKSRVIDLKTLLPDDALLSQTSPG
ncbi:hypothetical protein BRADI_1g58751v3, partial [Brachypodium distachyon]